MWWRFLENPAAFCIYLLALLAVLWNETSIAPRPAGAGFNIWLIAAILVAILTLASQYES
jgi:hypothetical protein